MLHSIKCNFYDTFMLHLSVFHLTYMLYISQKCFLTVIQYFSGVFSVSVQMQVFAVASHMLTSRVSSSHCCVTLEEGEIFKYGTRLKTSAAKRDATRAGLRATWSVYRRYWESSWACCVMTAGVTECTVVSRSSSELSLAPDKQKWVSVCFPAFTHPDTLNLKRIRTCAYFESLSQARTHFNSD